MNTKEVEMLWTIFAILLVLWLLGFGFHVAGSLIHLLLVTHDRTPTGYELDHQNNQRKKK